MLMEARGFIDSVRNTASLFGMDVSRPLALVSGGPDSVALLRAILELGGEPNVLHINHGLRADESEADERFVRDLCEGLGVRCEVRRVHFSGSNFQERAREERYRISAEAAREFGCSSIATGHNSDDVAETVLMNLARGAGLRGLSGIPPKRGNIVRPLIGRSRDEILAYLGAIGQVYRTDSTNLAAKYSRNRVRLEVLPVLEEMHPGASRSISRAANLAREALEALEEIASDAVEAKGGEVIVYLDRARSPALLRHAVRLGYEKAAPDEPPLGSKLVEAVAGAAEKTDGTRIFDLPGGVVAAVRFGREVAFYKAVETEAGTADLVSGEMVFGGWEVSVREGVGFDGGDAAKVNVAYLDGGRGPYRVRMVREGDTMRPMGLGGRKKVFRAMMDRKAPKDVRRKTPVVVDGNDEVAWVFLGETGEKFAVGPETGGAIRVEVRKT
ncbi:MAG: tRNA lysidine(34) synthetase TilS [Rubrobacter sp.]|nr:tRNA lysidine(34) synthetase TilS [Rubrobacter sp.]